MPSTAHSSRVAPAQAVEPKRGNGKAKQAGHNVALAVNGQGAAAAIADDPASDHESPQRARKRRRRDSSGSLAVPKGIAAGVAVPQEDEPAQEPELVHVRHAQVGRRTNGNRSRSRARKQLRAAEKAHTTVVDVQDAEMDDAPQAGPSRSDPVAKSETKTSPAPSAAELAALSEEIANLKAQLVDKSTIIDRQHATLEAVHNSLQCEICLLLLDRPFVMPKCGHVACQGCLEAWFSSAPQPQHHDVLEEPGFERPLWARRKTCPHCRQAVTRPPAPLFLAKNLAKLVSAPNLLDKTALRDGSVPPDAGQDHGSDPFSKYFPPERGDGPLRDEQDGVLRCPHCFHEIYNGECEGCGHVWDHDDELMDGGNWDFDDGSGSESESEDAHSLNDFIEDDHYVPHLGDLLNILNGQQARRYHVSDDGDSHADDHGRLEDLDSDEDHNSAEDTGDESIGRGRSVQRPINRRVVNDALVDDDDSDEEEEVDNGPARPVRRIGRVIPSSDHELDSDDSQPVRRVVRTRAAVPVAPIAISDSEGEDEVMHDAQSGDEDGGSGLSHSDGYDSGTGSDSNGSESGGSEGGVFFDAESLEGSEADYSDDEL